LKIAVLTLAFLTLFACGQTKPKAQKQYPLIGKVISVNAKEHTAMVDAASIPGFMDAMKMDYPIPSDSDLASLKAGENITATVNVADDGSYSLSGIHPAEAGK
jgi:hypothetical protein